MFDGDVVSGPVPTLFSDSKFFLSIVTLAKRPHRAGGILLIVPAQQKHRLGDSIKLANC
jgi:hypothetical protein